MVSDFTPVEGSCTCGHVRYRMNAAPMIVHACHCTYCQKQTGSVFGTNAVIEAEEIELLSGTTKTNKVETDSGNGQIETRCPQCHDILWSEYLAMTRGVTDLIYFLHVGTLDSVAKFPPDVHIYSSTKVPWLDIPTDARVFEGYYPVKEVWSDESRKRLRATLSKAQNT